MVVPALYAVGRFAPTWRIQGIAPLNMKALSAIGMRIASGIEADKPFGENYLSHIAYIALGSNLGNRRLSVTQAVAALRADPGVGEVTLSSLRTTDPVGGPAGQGPYLNAAARVETVLGPESLLGLLLEIERSLGRVRRERWGPRTIDLDLLLYDDRVIDLPGLTVPHPRMHERRFVLEPLAEIAREVVHPILGKSVARLLAELVGAKRQGALSHPDGMMGESSRLNS